MIEPYSGYFSHFWQFWSTKGWQYCISSYWYSNPYEIHNHKKITSISIESVNFKAIKNGPFDYWASLGLYFYESAIVLETKFLVESQPIFAQNTRTETKTQKPNLKVGTNPRNRLNAIWEEVYLDTQLSPAKSPDANRPSNSPLIDGLHWIYSILFRDYLGL